MACNSINTLNGLGEECAKAVGGVKKVYIALRSDIDMENITVSNNVISAISAVSGVEKPFKTYEFHKNTASMTTETAVADDDYPQFNTTVSMVFSKMTTDKRVEMMALALKDTVAIVETVEGSKFFLGFNMGLLVSALGGETGTLYSDKNQYTISLVDHAEQLPYHVTADLTALIKDAPAA